MTRQVIAAALLGALAGLVLSTAIQLGMTMYHDAQLQVRLDEMTKSEREVLQ